MNRKSIMKSILALFFVLVLVACNDEQPLVYKVSMEVGEVAFSFEESVQEVKLKSNYKWSVSEKPEWMSALPDHGEKGEYVIKLECVPNPLEEERAGILKIVCGDETRTLEIIQERLRHLKFHIADTLLMESRMDLNLPVVADVSYDVILPADCGWIRKKATSDGSLVLSVDHLDQNTQREAEVIIKAVDYRLSDTLRVLQVSNDFYARKILAKFYYAMDGEHWTNRTNWLSDSPLEEWYGVRFDVSGKMMLELSFNNLSGEIPPELYNLDLAVLDLGWNRKIEGRLLPEIGNWKNMFGLSLMGTELSGPVPDELWVLPNLNGLYLESSYLDPVTIDYEALSHTRITSIHLSGMKLINGLSPEIGLLTDLEYLSFTANQMTGIIPDELYTLKRLWYIDLGMNQLEGRISPLIGNLSLLVRLYLRENRLTGKIPEELWNLTNLQTIAIGDNLFDAWTIPEQIGHISGLRYFEAPKCNLEGTFPDAMWQLVNLTSLSLAGNHMSGPLPREIGNLVNLNYLMIGGNNFTGTIPEELGNLILLYELNVCDNYFTGKIPKSVTSLPNWGSFNPYSLYPQKNGISLEPEF